MKNSLFFPLVFLGLATLGTAQALPQSLLQPSPMQPEPAAAEQPAENGVAAAGDANDATAYAEGTRAIQEGRWADAEAIFDKVARGHSEHTEGALYWKAYAENKQGNSASALKTCTELRQSYPNSRWIQDCGALEIEIRGKNGQPVEPQSQHDADLKLLALSELMQRDEGRALPQAQQILSGDAPESRKEQVLFMLAQSGSKKAQKLLAEVANPKGDSPANIRSNTALQARAQRLMAALHQTAVSADSQVIRRVGLDVVVTDADGKPVSGLQPQDFTVLDNGKETKILGFQESQRTATKTEPVGDTKVIFLFDTVNSSLMDMAYARDQVAEFLRQDGGKLTHPVELLAFNGNGAQSIAPPSLNGNALADALEKAETNLHPILRSAAYWGAVERLQLSLGTLSAIASDEARLTGRKLLFWISPGWPMLIGTQNYPSGKELQTFFNAIVSMSSDLRLARIVLYSLDPIRTGADLVEWNYYKNYLKGVPNAKQATAADLALQVLATQSGGNVMNYSTKDMWQEISSNIASADAFYFLALHAPPAEHVDEYHALKITVDKPGLTVHTRSGYYNEP